MDSKALWVTLALLLSTAVKKSHPQTMSCTYGARGSLTSTCINATPIYFRTTSYRFDNLDETVRCVDCRLDTIESNTFDISGNQIKNLDLTSSKISVLKPKAFMGLIFVQTLLMPNNNIETIPAETFQGINKIELLDLENNKLARLVTNGFKELTNMKKLKMGNNKIASIEVGAFDGLGALEELDLSNNEITMVNDIFVSLYSVGVINLEGNKIAEIASLEMKEVNNLLELNLARNNLKKISHNAFLNLLRLETLNLSSNPLDDLNNGAFRGLYALEELDLSKCALKEISKGVLSALHHLRKLDLSNNQIQYFKTGVYSGLPELRKLNLSHNKIEEYEKTGVFPLHSLHTLDLSFNNMKDLDYKSLVYHMPSLAYIELDHNPWPCYLGKEMEELFLHDNFYFSVGKEFADPNVKCADSRPAVSEGAKGDDGDGGAQTASLVAESTGHQYVLYIFIFVSLGLMGFLFYLQYRNQREIQDIVGKRNVSEVQLLASSDLEARDDF